MNEMNPIHYYEYVLLKNVAEITVFPAIKRGMNIKAFYVLKECGTDNQTRDDEEQDKVLCRGNHRILHDYLNDREGNQFKNFRIK